MTEADAGLDSLSAFPTELREPAVEPLAGHTVMRPAPVTPRTPVALRSVPGGVPRDVSRDVARHDAPRHDTPRDDTAPPSAVGPEPKQAWGLIAAGAIAAMLCVGAIQMVGAWWSGGSAAADLGGLTVDTRPAGADVLVDGQLRGVAPLRLSVKPGAHTVAVRLGRNERSVPVTIAAGGTVAQYFELSAAAASPAPAVLGSVAVTTTPVGARVFVDGRSRGVSPLTIADLAAGDHRVAVERDAAKSERVVAVQPGTTASVVFTLAGRTGPVGGWLTVTSPFDVQVIESDDVVGMSASSRIMLPAGRHTLTLANGALGFTESKTVDITPGRVTTVRVDPPKAALNVNARPWADVFIGDINAGQTPIANVPVSIGTHQVVFRHPQLGERRETVVVTAKGPNRVSVDLTR
jgi:hypothetical protein